jgi:peptide/nickel transport system substrate-binding protein
VRRTRAAIIVSLLATTVGVAAAPSAAADPVRLTVGVVGSIGSLDIADGTSDVAREVWKLQYPTLTAYARADLATIPGLAESWTPSPDGREFVYTLRPATWSDGTPVSANDVVTSLERARDEGWPYAGDTFAALEARAIDDRTVAVSTTGGVGALPALPVHVLPASGDRSRASGDFHVVDVSDSEVRLEVVDRPGRPALDEIVFRTFRDADALQDALASGEVDIAAGFAAGDLAAVRAVSDASAIHANDGDQWLLEVRIDDPSVREAIARSIDRDALVLEAAGGAGRPAVAPIVARGAEWQLEEEDVRVLAEDLRYAPDEARALIEGAGAVRALTLAAPDDDAGDAIATAVIDSLDAIGISAVRTDDLPADLTVELRDPTDDPTAELGEYTCAGEVWCDAAYDDAFARFAAATSPASRQAAARDMVRRLADGLPEVVLFAPDELQAYRVDDVAGILRNPEESRLVVFWPSVEQYREMVPAAPAASEEIPATTFALLAIGTLVAVTAGVVVIDRRIQARR